MLRSKFACGNNVLGDNLIESRVQSILMIFFLFAQFDSESYNMIM